MSIVKGWALKPADAIHLATAKRAAVTEFHTYDAQRLEKFTILTGYKIIEPQTDRLSFPSQN